MRSLVLLAALLLVPLGAAQEPEGNETTPGLERPAEDDAAPWTVILLVVFIVVAVAVAIAVMAQRRRR